MAQKPLLFFPTKGTASRSLLDSGVHKSDLKFPSPTRQGERLTSKFQQLFDAIHNKRIEVQQTPTGVDPEQVLVFETVGSVEDFAKAVSRIGGLDWLGEIDIENINSDEDFYTIDTKSQNKKTEALKGKLYFVFTNDRAMRQLLSLWKLWVEHGDFDVKKGEHRGKGKLKEVFKQLHDIRRWNVIDRFEETDILEYWEEDLRLNPDRVLRFEIELWFSKTRSKRENAVRIVSSFLQELGGKAISTCEVTEIHYHGILAELPASEIKKIISKQEIELVKCEQIMYFKPSGQVITKDEYDEDELETIEIARSYTKAEGEPIIALLDGLPLSQHHVLKDRLIIDDPENFEENYAVKSRKHGTAMSSLIINGDLNNHEEPISTPLYVRPIMRPNENDNRYESIPNDRLLIDRFHIAVRRIFERENNIEAVAPKVKIINLSIGDPDRLFYNSMSPWSRMLDWLSFRYRVLFIVSAGNHNINIEIGMNPEEFKDLCEIDKEKIFLNSTLDNAHKSRLMSPSESINCLTVGALHADSSPIPAYDNRLNPYNALMPATYTAFGGYKRSIKPNLVYYGGRLMYDFHISDNKLLTPTKYKRAPGIKVAAPSSTLNDTVFTCGTSNATALVTRSGFHCYEVLKQLNEEGGIEIPENLISVIIKAMLVHGCSWEIIGEELDKRLDIKDAQEIKKIKTQLFGYGLPDFNKVKECTEQRATVIGFGELTENEAHIYKLPLPPSLSAKTDKRKLTVTLAWFTPIYPANQRYRTSRLWFEANSSVTPNRRKASYDNNAVQRGTLQHEIFEGERATVFVEGDVISIKVNCKDEATFFTDSIPYALLVSLEVGEGIDIPIYQEISERISIPVAIRQ